MLCWKRQNGRDQPSGSPEGQNICLTPNRCSFWSVQRVSRASYYSLCVACAFTRRWQERAHTAVSHQNLLFHQSIQAVQSTPTGTVWCNHHYWFDHRSSNLKLFAYPGYSHFFLSCVVNVIFTIKCCSKL